MVITSRSSLGSRARLSGFGWGLFAAVRVRDRNVVSLVIGVSGNSLLLPKAKVPQLARNCRPESQLSRSNGSRECSCAGGVHSLVGQPFYTDGRYKGRLHGNPSEGRARCTKRTNWIEYWERSGRSRSGVGAYRLGNR